ncbi:hypothetical protein MUK42_07873 [Musa troglodytarum]|uniref:NAC domain-containing protein n=1 Tax=Musa troglodytarum TaxID=320322 RepID=A0A9E7HWR4_9LILI|nr:hypothetical protein MUK42_07873 [Musa troglodytarum]
MHGSKGWNSSWTLNKKQEPVKSIIGECEMVVGRKSYLSFNNDRWKNFEWTMYKYEMSSSGFQCRVLYHVKKNSHQPIPIGDLIKTVESAFMETATETATNGSSFVGQKRNREDSSTLSLEAPNLSKKPALQSDVSPPPTAVVQQPVVAPVVLPPESHLSLVNSIARTKPESQLPLHRQRMLVETA